MDTREYVAQAIEKAGANLKSVSVAMGRNHAYLQQYVKGLSPSTLAEQDREFLVQQFQLDAERLKPPARPRVPAKMLTARGQAFTTIQAELGKIDAKQPGEFVHENNELRLLALWRAMPESVREAMMTVAIALTRASASGPKDTDLDNVG